MNFRFIIIILLLTVATRYTADAQTRYGKGYYNSRIEIGPDNDTIPIYDMITIYCFAKPADMRKYARLVNNVKKVYPIAKEARAKLAEMEQHLLTLNSKRDQRNYIRRMEKEIEREYTPILKKMTFSQGKILIKLIDRETDHTSYEIVKELRGGFRATFWQGIARLFGANLKDQYDKNGEDKVIEQIILLYEAGLI